MPDNNTQHGPGELSLKKKRDQLLNVLGIDRAVRYTLFNRSWMLASGLLTMVFIAGYFSVEQQGYYYTFYSLLAMQIFVELGMSGVIATFASHEFAALQWGEKGEIHGDPLAMNRFIDLVSKTVKWFGIAAIVLMFVLIPAGLLFFSKGQVSAVAFAWQLPWVLAVIGTAINLLSIPFFSAIMGSGDVVAVNYRELIGGLVGSLLSWAVIALGGGLYAFCVVSCCNIIVTWVYLVRYKPRLLTMVWNRIREKERRETKNDISWRQEVWPLQWRTAIAWAFGYLSAQLFNPVLFYYHGPVIAGQMGMTLNASAAMLVIATTWINARTPEFAKLIAVRQWSELDRMFSKVTKQCIGVVSFGGISLLAIMTLLHTYTNFGQRFLPVSQAAFLVGSYWILTIVSTMAVYLSAHKKEPYLTLSVVGAIVQGAATWYFGMRYGAMGAASSFFIISLISFPFPYYIWRRCRAEWHGLN